MLMLFGFIHRSLISVSFMSCKKIWKIGDFLRPSHPVQRTSNSFHIIYSSDMWVYIEYLMFLPLSLPLFFIRLFSVNSQSHSHNIRQVLPSSYLLLNQTWPKSSHISQWTDLECQSTHY